MSEPRNLQHEFLEKQLKAYVDAFACMTPDTFKTELSKVFADDVYFQDPFNQVHGKANTLKVFAHMYQTLHQPTFSISHYAISPGRTFSTCANHQTLPAGKNVHKDLHQNLEFIGLILWDFHFALKTDTPPMQIQGTSKVTFNAEGLVDSHIDFWDAGSEVYAKVPLLGWMIRKVRHKLSAS